MHKVVVCVHTFERSPLVHGVVAQWVDQVVHDIEVVQPSMHKLLVGVQTFERSPLVHGVVAQWVDKVVHDIKVVEFWPQRLILRPFILQIYVRIFSVNKSYFNNEFFLCLYMDQFAFAWMVLILDETLNIIIVNTEDIYT